MASYYPPVSFKFRVEFMGVAGMDEDKEQRFQDVSGLTFEIETEVLKEGGENRFEYKLPKRAKYPNLILKRGLLKSSVLIKWFQDAMNTYFTVALYDFKPADIMITLLDEADGDVAIWNVKQAYPLKWTISDFKSTDNSVVIESIELAYQYFERKL